MSQYPDSKEVKQLAQKNKDVDKALITRLKRKPPVKLDEIVHELHIQAFDEYDCLTCANCCRSLGPRITDRDIEKLAKNLRLKPSDFTTKYLRIDEDGDYVFCSMPCPFLMPDNYCSVYEDRPKACREYPHTDRRKFYQILDITYKNIPTCPVVYKIVNDLKSLKL